MQLENIKALTESIKKGERVVLFPPGITSLIALVLILIVTTVLVASSIINIFFYHYGIETKALVQFSGLGIAVVFAIFPNLMVLSGKMKFSIMCFYYSLSIAILSFTILLSGFFQLFSLNNATYPLLASIALSITCIFIYRSASYQLIKNFFYYLKNSEAN